MSFTKNQNLNINIFLQKGAIFEEKMLENIVVCQKLENLHNSEKVSYITQHGIIQSPNYPEKYSKNENCIFSLKGQNFQIFNF